MQHPTLISLYCTKIGEKIRTVSRKGNLVQILPWIFVEPFQILRQHIDNSGPPCYHLPQLGPLYHNKANKLFHRPAFTPNHFAAIHLRQNPLVPCGAVSFIPRDLQPNYRPAILDMHLDSRISRLDGIQCHDPAAMRASLTTPLQNRGRNFIRCERRPPQAGDTSMHLHFQLCRSFLDLDFQNGQEK